MKKKLSVLLIFVMLMTLITACGKEGVSSSNKNKADKNVTSTEAEPTEADTDEKTSKADSDEKTSKADKATKATKAEDATVEKTSGTPQRGTVTDSKYTNSSIGVNFPLSAFSTIMTDNQIGTLMGYSQKLLDSNGMLTSEQIEKLTNGVVYDFMGYFSDGKSNVIVMYEDMTKTCGKIVTESLYLDSIMSQLTQMGYKFDSTSTPTEIAGAKYYKLTATVNGLTQNYYCRVMDKYMVSIILTTISGNESTGEDFIKSITK